MIRRLPIIPEDSKVDTESDYDHEKETRKTLLKKVYGLIIVNIIIAICFSSLVMHQKLLQKYIRLGSQYLPIAFFLTRSLAMYFEGRHYLLKFLFLSIFTISQAIAAGKYVIGYKSKQGFETMCIVPFVFIIITVIAFKLGTYPYFIKYSYSAPLLYPAALVAASYIENRNLYTIIHCIAVPLFVQRIIKHTISLKRTTSKEYIDIALSIYLDIAFLYCSINWARGALIPTRR